MTSIDLNGKTVYTHRRIPGPDDARWTILYGMLQAHTSVARASITRGSPWVDEYFARRRALEASGGGTLARRKAVGHCIASSCLSLLAISDPADKYELTEWAGVPANRFAPWTLAHFYTPWTVSARIVSDDEFNKSGWGSVHAELLSGPALRAPTCGISPLPMQALWRHLPASPPRFRRKRTAG